MGNPQNFSVDIRRRCQILIDELWPPKSVTTAPSPEGVVPACDLHADDQPADRADMETADGAYSRAFERQRPKQSIGCGNSENIGEQPISQVPFYQPDAWRYHHLPMRNGPPGPFARRSACRRESCSRIASGADCRGCANAALFCNILRNGLAHGSVLHLAEHGRSTFGVPVRTFCFVSTKGKDRKVEACIFCAWP